MSLGSWGPSPAPRALLPMPCVQICLVFWTLPPGAAQRDPLQWPAPPHPRLSWSRWPPVPRPSRLLLCLAPARWAASFLGPFLSPRQTWFSAPCSSAASQPCPPRDPGLTLGTPGHGLPKVNCGHMTQLISPTVPNGPQTWCQLTAWCSDRKRPQKRHPDEGTGA